MPTNVFVTSISLQTDVQHSVQRGPNSSAGCDGEMKVSGRNSAAYRSFTRNKQQVSAVDRAWERQVLSIASGFEFQQLDFVVLTDHCAGITASVVGFWYRVPLREVSPCLPGVMQAEWDPPC